MRDDRRDDIHPIAATSREPWSIIVAIIVARRNFIFA